MLPFLWIINNSMDVREDLLRSAGKYETYLILEAKWSEKLVGISITKQKSEMKFPSESGDKTLDVHCGRQTRRSRREQEF